MFYYRVECFEHNFWKVFEFREAPSEELLRKAFSIPSDWVLRVTSLSSCYGCAYEKGSQRAHSECGGCLHDKDSCFFCGSDDK